MRLIIANRFNHIVRISPFLYAIRTPVYARCGVRTIISQRHLVLMFWHLAYRQCYGLKPKQRELCTPSPHIQSQEWWHVLMWLVATNINFQAINSRLRSFCCCIILCLWPTSSCYYAGGWKPIRNWGLHRARQFRKLRIGQCYGLTQLQRKLRSPLPHIKC